MGHRWINQTDHSGPARRRHTFLLSSRSSRKSFILSSYFCCSSLTSRSYCWRSFVTFLSFSCVTQRMPVSEIQATKDYPFRP